MVEQRSQALASILPKHPIRSSQPLGWSGVLVECYDFPAYEIPEYCHGQHKLTLQTKTQDSIKIKRVLNSKVRSEHLIEGDVVVVPAHTPHQVCWNQSAEFMLLTLEPTLLAQSSHDLITPDRVELIPQFPTSDPLVYQLGLALKQELYQPTFDRFYVESLTTALSAHLLKRYTIRPPQPIGTHSMSKVMLKQTIAYIQDHLDQEIRLIDLAQQFGFSPCYFAHLFKQATGVSPHQFVIQRRLESAKALLSTTNLAIVDIALQCGFTSQSHLSKLFRQHYQLTPTAYRRVL